MRHHTPSTVHVATVHERLLRIEDQDDKDDEENRSEVLPMSLDTSVTYRPDRSLSNVCICFYFN